MRDIYLMERTGRKAKPDYLIFQRARTSDVIEYQNKNGKKKAPSWGLMVSKVIHQCLVIDRTIF